MMPDPIFLNIHMYGIMIAIGVLCAFVGAISPSQFWSLLMVVAGVVVFFIVRHIYGKATKDETVS